MGEEKQSILIHDFRNNELKPFDTELLRNGIATKFIQVYINNKPYLRLTAVYHKSILEKTLNEFGIKFESGVLPTFSDLQRIDDSHKGPLMVGENYKMVGAGKIRLNGNLVEFYDASSHYSNSNRFLDTDPKHLEEIVKLSGFKIVSGEKKPCGDSFYLVDINPAKENKDVEENPSGTGIKSNLREDD